MAGLDFAHVVNAIVVAHNPQSDPSQLQTSNAVLSQLGSMDLSSLLSFGRQLISQQQPLEAQLYGCKILQSVFDNKWSTFGPNEQQGFTELVYGAIQEACQPECSWAVRSKTALLLALIFKRAGASLWQSAVPGMLQFGRQSPAHTRTVCAVLKQVAEEVTQYGDDLPTGPKRELVTALLDTLPAVLQFLCQALSGSYQAASQAASEGRQQVANEHVAVLRAALDACLAHVEWAPVGPVQEAGLLEAWTFLLQAPDFRLDACDLLRLLAGRKLLRNQEDPGVFAGVMTQVGQGLTVASRQLLTPQASPQLAPGGGNEEIGERLCATLAVFAQHAPIMTQGQPDLLEQALGFTVQANIRLVAEILGFWTTLMTPVPASKTNSGAPPPVQLSKELCANLLELAGARLRQWAHVEEGQDPPEGFEDLQEWRDFEVPFKSSLMQVLRLVAKRYPVEAIQGAMGKVLAALHAVSASSTLSEQEQLHTLDSYISFMEACVGGTCSDLASNPRGVPQAAVQGLEQLLGQLLAADLATAPLLTLQARAMDAMCPLAVAVPAAAVSIVLKVFDMFRKISLPAGDTEGCPPGILPPGWRSAYQARQRTAQIVLTLAKAAPLAVAEHAGTITGQVDQMAGTRLIWASERSTLAEALLVAAAGTRQAGIQTQVLSWALSPVMASWQGQDYNNAVSSLAAFQATFMPLQGTLPNGMVQVGGGPARWEAYHQMYVAERAIRRMFPPQGKPQDGGIYELHGLDGILAWVLPAVLRFLRCLHSLWDPQVQQAMQPARVAFELAPRERAAYMKRELGPGQSEEDSTTLGGALPASLRSWLRQSEEDSTTLGGALRASLGSWLRQTREMLYQLVGLLGPRMEAFPACGEASSLWVPTLAAHIPQAQRQHLRLLIRHILQPLTRACPPHLRSQWINPVLAPLMLHCQADLPQAYQALQSATPADAGGSTADEVIQAAILAELSTDYLGLVLHLVGGALPLGSPATVDVRNSDLGQLAREAPNAVVAAVATAGAALHWEGLGTKAAAICRQAVGLAGESPELQQLLGRDVLLRCLAVLADPSAPHQDLLFLARALIATFMGHQPDPLQVLQSLPRATPGMLASFRDSFQAAAGGRHPEKDQRTLVKELLRVAGTEEHAKALSDAKSVVPITNLAPRKQRSKSVDAEVEPDDNSFLTAALFK